MLGCEYLEELLRIMEYITKFIAINQLQNTSPILFISSRRKISKQKPHNFSGFCGLPGIIEQALLIVLKISTSQYYFVFLSAFFRISLYLSGLLLFQYVNPYLPRFQNNSFKLFYYIPQQALFYTLSLTLAHSKFPLAPYFFSNCHNYAYLERHFQQNQNSFRKMKNKTLNSCYLNQEKLIRKNLQTRRSASQQSNHGLNSIHSLGVLYVSGLQWVKKIS